MIRRALCPLICAVLILSMLMAGAQADGTVELLFPCVGAPVETQDGLVRLTLEHGKPGEPVSTTGARGLRAQRDLLWLGVREEDLQGVTGLGVSAGDMRAILNIDFLRYQREHGLDGLRVLAVTVSGLPEGTSLPVLLLSGLMNYQTGQRALSIAPDVPHVLLAPLKGTASLRLNLRKEGAEKSYAVVYPIGEGADGEAKHLLPTAADGPLPAQVTVRALPLAAYLAGADVTAPAPAEAGTADLVTEILDRVGKSAVIHSPSAAEAVLLPDGDGNILLHWNDENMAGEYTLCIVEADDLDTELEALAWQRAGGEQTLMVDASRFTPGVLYELQLRNGPVWTTKTFYVTSDAPGTGIIGTVTITSGRGANLRGEGHAESAQVGKARAGDTFPCTGVAASGWYEIILPDGGTAYVSGKVAELAQ